MKKIVLLVITSTVAAVPVYAANYSSFIAPSSLGKDVEVLNSQYKLGLKKQNWNGYSNAGAGACQLDVEVTKGNKIRSIRIINSASCRYITKSNVTYNSKTNTTKDLLSQVDVENIQFIPGCFNCPSTITISDNLLIDRSIDPYYTKFEISGYNKSYLGYIAKKLFGNPVGGNYNAMMDMLELRAAQEIDFYDRNAFKIQAIKSYDLQDKPLSYTIIVK